MAVYEQYTQIFSLNCITFRSDSQKYVVKWQQSICLFSWPIVFVGFIYLFKNLFWKLLQSQPFENRNIF